jgi:hypothetical protein
MTTLIERSRIVNDTSDLGRAIVTLSIEKALIDVGKPVYALVLDRLETDKTTIPDFYEDPAYLQLLLEELFGAAHGEIIKSIKKYLEEFSDQVQIKNFLNSLN